MSRCYLNIKNSKGKLTASESALAEFILENPEKAVAMSINELAEVCSTSKSTVVRFCKTLGYRGFKELCMELNSDIRGGRDSLVYADILPDDDIEAVLKNICDNNIKTVRSTYDLIDRSDFSKAVEVLANAKRIDFYGVGASGLIAVDAQCKFMRIGKFSAAQCDPHMQSITVSSLTKGDAAVFITYSGETTDTIETMKLAHESGATVISITRLGTNTAGSLSDIRLYTVSDEGFIRSGPMASRIGLLTVIDMLFSAVASRCYTDIKSMLDRTQKISLGKKLK